MDIYLLSVKLVERAAETLRELFFLHLFLVNYFTIGVNQLLLLFKVLLKDELVRVLSQEGPLVSSLKLLSFLEWNLIRIYSCSSEYLIRVQVERDFLKDALVKYESALFVELFKLSEGLHILLPQNFVLFVDLDLTQDPLILFFVATETHHGVDE